MSSQSLVKMLRFNTLLSRQKKSVLQRRGFVLAPKSVQIRLKPVCQPSNMTMWTMAGDGLGFIIDVCVDVVKGVDK